MPHVIKKIQFLFILTRNFTEFPLSNFRSLLNSSVLFFFAIESIPRIWHTHDFLPQELIFFMANVS